MKIQTNAGEVELTAEMVVRGMVFQAPGHAPYTLLRRIAEFGDWVGSDGLAEQTKHLLDAEVRTFLGCDPTIATRADCERFGVHGDAAAHGFARLRCGGAVDLRREAPEGAVYEHMSGGRRYTTGAAVPFTSEMRFIGLHVGDALPSEVKRLCCGSRNEVLRSNVCTLAIGDHDEHEDIATGVRWPAKAERYEYTAQATSSGFRFTDPPHAATDKIRLKPYTWGAAWPAETEATVKESARRLAEWEEAAKVPGTAQNVQREAMRDAWADAAKWPAKEIGQRRPDTFAAPAKHVCGKCGGPACVGFGGPLMVAILGNAAKACKPCADAVCATIDAYEIRDGRIMEKRALPSPTFRGMPFPEQTARKSPPCKCGVLGPDIADHLHAKGCAVVRQRQEAPLLALVAAVPEGLNPIGWRAAVLAAAERYRADVLDMPDRFRREVVALCKSGEPVPCGTLTAVVLAVVAYRRAIAPHKAPPPERKRGRGLPIDDGGHYE